MHITTGGIKFLQFEQNTPSSVWTIFHGFGTKPLVDVNVILNGVVTKAFPMAIIHDDDNNVTISWSSPYKGIASLASTVGV